jgi:fructokinase
VSRFLVAGEALVDVIPRPDGGEAAYPGGSPRNVAIGLARLGHEVRELAYIGDDEYGRLLDEQRRDAGVRPQPGALTAPASSVARVTLNAAGDASYDFSVLWDVPTTIDWAVDGAPVEVVHAGSIALALEPGAGHLLELLRSRPAGVRVTIDPNVRPAFLPREGAAERVEPFLALADLVKLSADDADHLYPGLTASAVLDHVLSLGPSIAALTRAADGALLATAETVVEVPALAREVVDTVAAGDSFMASLVAAVAEAGEWHPDGALLVEFGGAASRASAFAVGHAGPWLPTRAERDGIGAGDALRAGDTLGAGDALGAR